MSQKAVLVYHVAPPRWHLVLLAPLVGLIVGVWIVVVCTEWYRGLRTRLARRPSGSEPYN
jgi:hypothetical protein